MMKTRWMANHIFGGGRSKAGGKAKKMPQRGLGVAQLEKIIIEEQQKKEAIEAAANVLSTSSAANGTVTIPCLDVHFPIQVGKHVLNGGNWGRDLEGDKDLGFAVWPQLHPTVLVPQRSLQFQRPCSTVGNESSGILPSVVLSSQLEPPSNQSSCSNSYATPPQPEERKMVGIKRPYPFPLDHPPGHFHHPSKLCADVSSSCTGNHKEASINKYRRESNSSSVKLSGDFLTLAPPSDSEHPLDHSVPSISLFTVKSETRNGDGDEEEAIDLNLKL